MALYRDSETRPSRVDGTTAGFQKKYLENRGKCALMVGRFLHRAGKILVISGSYIGVRGSLVTACMEMKMIGVGVDFGTSNSAVAWFDGQRLRLVSLEQNGTIMPTATHLDRDLVTTTGEEAVEQYIEENRDRTVELTAEVIAKTSMVVSESNPLDPHSESESVDREVYGQATNDRGLPGRLFRGIKRLLGNSDIRRLIVFDHPFRLVALITPVLLRMRTTVESIIDSSVARIHVGHPVKFEGHDKFRNKLALSRLGEACNHAGFKQVVFYPEPVAATLSFLHDEKHDTEGTVLTVDFGGGTLDLSVVRYSGTEFEVLATDGLSLGGDHIDQLIFTELLFPLLGKGEMWSRVVDGSLITNEFPFDEFEPYLLNWAVTYTLNQNRYRSKVVDCVRQGGELALKFQRLDDLITHNYSYIVFQAIKSAKAELSSVEETVLDIAELDLTIPFKRERLESMMVEMLAQIRSALDDLLVQAGLAYSEVDVVIRTGGSSQIVAVKKILEGFFPGKVTEHDPFTSVAAGLAIASYHDYQFVGVE
jgi:hypothetical chaperone protein